MRGMRMGDSLPALAAALKGICDQTAKTSEYKEHEYFDPAVSVSFDDTTKWLQGEKLPVRSQLGLLETAVQLYNQDKIQPLHIRGLITDMHAIYEEEEATDLEAFVETAKLPRAKVENANRQGKVGGTRVLSDEEKQHNKSTTIKMLNAIDAWPAQMGFDSTDAMIEAFIQEQPSNIRPNYYREAVKRFETSPGSNLDYKFWDGVIACGRSWNANNSDRPVDVASLQALDAALVCARPVAKAL